MAIMWIYDNWKGFTTLRKKLLLAFNIFVFLAGVFVMITGTWGAAVAINDQLKAGDTTRSVLAFPPTVLTPQSFLVPRQLWIISICMLCLSSGCFS